MQCQFIFCFQWPDLLCCYTTLYTCNTKPFFVTMRKRLLQQGAIDFGLCPRFILAIDCIWPHVPTSWFLPHAGLHLVTVHFWSQELGHGMRYRPVSSPHHLSLFILATFENFSVWVTTAWITLISVLWSWNACTKHHINPGELNWTELFELLILYSLFLVLVHPHCPARTA